MYKTLPAALRRGGHHSHDKDCDDDENDTDGTAAAGTASEASSVPPRSQSRASTRGHAGQEAGGLFGLNIGISNLISGGIRNVNTLMQCCSTIFLKPRMFSLFTAISKDPKLPIQLLTIQGGACNRGLVFVDIIVRSSDCQLDCRAATVRSGT